MFHAARRTNEAAVLDILPTMRDSLNRFYAQYQAYPGSLHELVDAGLLQPTQAQTHMHGYEFTYIISERDFVGLRFGRRLYSKFLVMARAETYLTGKRMFFIDESGAIIVLGSRDWDAKREKVFPPPSDWRQTHAPGSN